MSLRVPKRGRNPYRAKAGAKGLDTTWRDDMPKYMAAVAAAQAKADAAGIDVGLFPIDLHQTWEARYLPAKPYRTGDDTLNADGRHCEVIVSKRQ